MVTFRKMPAVYWHYAIAIGVALFDIGAASSYEFATHAAITRDAYLLSRLSAGAQGVSSGLTLRARLGLEDRSNALGGVYLDMSRGDADERLARPKNSESFADHIFDEANRKLSNPPKASSIGGWLMLGSIREDDVPFDAGEKDNTPQDDPAGQFTRVLHHFYDPYNDRPLNALGVDLGESAPQWALRGAKSVYGSQNGFSMAMAREAMWRAITLKHYVPNVFGRLVDVSFSPTVNIHNGAALRTAYWATTFRSLGDVVHLLQDMAQPQHTRNDAHGGLACAWVGCVAGHKSYYEAFVEAKVRGASTFLLRDRFFWRLDTGSGIERVRLDDLTYDEYPIVRMSTAQSYFSTAVGGASTLGQGLANYSNQGFYTAGTVVGTSYAAFYGSPPATRGQLGAAVLKNGSVLNAAGLPIPGAELRLLVGPVRDHYLGSKSENDVPLASEGAFDQFLQGTLISHVSLNHYNYLQQARLLIPRAVSYSAGLLDHFFRGTLDLSPPEEGVFSVSDVSTSACVAGCGFRMLKLKLTNATPDEVLGPGTAVAVARFHRNTCYGSDLSGEPGSVGFRGNDCRGAEEEIAVSDAQHFDALASNIGRALKFEFNEKSIPLDATDIALQVVFRGKLGAEEDVVVVTTRDIAEPNYVAVENSSDYRFNSTLKTFAPSGSPAPFSNVTVKFGNATKPVATVPLMPAPGHAQLAFLGDKAPTPISIDMTVPQMSFSHPIQMSLPAFEFYKAAGNGSTYTSNWPVALVRGVYRRFVFPVAWSGNLEVYFCSDLFNPAACNESTLPPLTSANAVAWNVDFK